MALTYNKNIRDLSIKGTITMSTGEQVHLTADEIISYSFDSQIGSEGLPLGSAEAATFSLSIDNVGRKYTPAQFDNAEVHMFVGIKNDNGTDYVFSDFGVWYVDDSTAPEQSTSISLSGCDALATRFEATFTDDKAAYPTTIGDIASVACLAAGIKIKAVDFPNAAVTVKSMPEWGEEITLRDVLSYCAVCAGGYVRIARNGQLEIVGFAEGKTYEIGPDTYQTFTLTSGTAFKFNAIEALLAEDAEEYSRFAIDSSIESNAANTIQINYNPLLTETIIQSITTELDGIEMDAGTLGWGGDPVVLCTDFYDVTMLNGTVRRIMVTDQRFSFDGGLSVTESCELPAINTVSSPTYSTSTNMYDAKGRLKATHIAGFDTRVVKASAGHFDRLTAGTIEADELTVALLDALNLRAQVIDTDSIETDELTSIIANIINATIRKLDAGIITSDELYSSFAALYTLKAKSITAQNILTDNFASEFARIVVLAAGTASFDKATVQHLVAEAMNLQYGVAGQVFIRNLAVEYAQMIGAAIGKLCIKASDGNYYQIDVKPNGAVSATKVSLNSSEISAGQTSSGRVILETNITAANLNTSNLLATYALVNRIDAARLDVDELFARNAFIDMLTTSRIFGGKSLEIYAGEIENASRVFRQEEFPDGTILVKPGDLLVKPSLGQQYQAVEDGEIQFALDSDGNLYYSYDGAGSLQMQGFGLYAEGFTLPIDASGAVVSVPYEWILVEDLQLREAIAAQAQKMAEAVLELNKDIENLQEQIDGNITTWFESYVPTISNYPASEWTTEDLKNQHLGDLFYVENPELEENGYCYRWQYTNNVYSWVLLQDSGVAKALAAAAKAQDTADSKRRVFFATPVPPYDAGDLWVQGEDGDIMRCATAKNDGQSYAVSDWVKASKYTDDTIANEALSKSIYDSAFPPTAAPEAGKLWLDRSVVPPVLRRWLGISLQPDDLDGWETVNDTATIEEAQAALDAVQKQSEAAIKELQTVVRVDTVGLHVGKVGSDASEVLIENDRVNIIVRGKAYAVFASDYMILGEDMELRRAASGGLAIGPV